MLAFKKSCGNTVKFATQNIPYAIIQVLLRFSFLFLEPSSNPVNKESLNDPLCHGFFIIQAVIIAVYGFGLVTLMARNFDQQRHVVTDEVIGFIPLMPSMQVRYLTLLSLSRDAHLATVLTTAVFRVLCLALLRPHGRRPFRRRRGRHQRQRIGPIAH